MRENLYNLIVFKSYRIVIYDEIERLNTDLSKH